MTSKKALDYYRSNKPNKIILKHQGGLIESLAMTALVRDIHKCYPGFFNIDVRTPHPEVWENNKLIIKIDGRSAKNIKFKFNLEDFCASYQTHFIGMFHDHFNAVMGLDVKLTIPKADIYISDEEGFHSPIDGPFWIVDTTFDYIQPTKAWNVEKYDELIGHLNNVNIVRFVDHDDLRNIIVLYHHCDGVICHASSAPHLSGSIPFKNRDSSIRPCIVIAGNVDDEASNFYNGHDYINSIGTLDCCRSGGCNLNVECLDEIHLINQKVSRCMNDITVDYIINILKKYISINSTHKKNIKVDTNITDRPHEYTFPKLSYDREYLGTFYRDVDYPTDLNALYEGMSAFVILGGPSLKDTLNSIVTINGKEYTGEEALNYPGFVTLSVNNSTKTIRSDLWTCVDPPSHFIKSIWLDPRIQKIVPIGKRGKKIFDSDKWEFTDIYVKECPNVFYYRLNNHFDPNNFLESDTFNWGENGNTKCELGIKGKRSVMLPSLRILYELGFKNVYLLGCDFKMTSDNTYHFEQKRHDGSINSNTNSYNALKQRFDSLTQIFKEKDFNVYNCYMESGLKSFPYMSFQDAINDATQLMPNLETERTQGLYDREKNEREEEERKELITIMKTEKTGSYNYIENDFGVLYFNSGTKCLARLITSIHSLRKVYDGDICIISSGEESKYVCEGICEEYRCTFKEIDKTLNMKRDYWFEKSRMHLYTPFDNTLFIDSDTIIHKDPSELFDMIKTEEFVVPQFSSWTTHTSVIKKRLRRWDFIDKDLVDFTIQNKFPSVNVGVFGFNKNSNMMKNWFDFTIQNETATLPEESSCHLLLNLYKGKVIDSLYNYSCKHEKKNIDNAYIIHFHGNKHCRLDNDGTVLFNGQIWTVQWKEVYDKNICNIQKWYDKIGDGKLKGYMENYHA